MESTKGLLPVMHAKTARGVCDAFNRRGNQCKTCGAHSWYVDSHYAVGGGITAWADVCCQECGNKA